MAIRDFGESLLADARERKDSQVRDARKYANKQQKKELLIAGGAWLGSQLWDIGNSAIAQKTQNFLGQSNLYDNKIKVANTEKIITEGLGYRDQAKTDGTSIYDVVLHNEASKAVAQKMKLSPNEIQSGEEEEWTSMYMNREETKSSARRLADYWKEVLTEADDFSTGRSKKTLDQLAKQSRPETIVGSIWNKVVGNDTSVDVLNHTMSQLPQIVAADKISALTLDLRIETAKKIIALGGDPSVAKLIVGGPTTTQEKENLKKMYKLGETFVESTPAITSNQFGVFSSKVKTITSQNKDIRVERVDTQILDANAIITQESMNTSLGRIPELYAMIEKRFTPAGQEAFEKEIQRLSKGKKLTPALITSFWLSSVKADWAPAGSDKAKLAPEVQASFIDALTDQTGNLTTMISANLGKTDTESKVKLSAAMNLYIKIQNDFMNAIQNRTGIINNSGSVIAPMKAVDSAGVPLPNGKRAVHPDGREIIVENGYWILI
jgi:hypothetical protein